MDLVFSVLNIVFFLFACIIVLGIFTSAKRTEKAVQMISKKLTTDESTRVKHMELMSIELEAMHRSREELRAQVLTCREHLERLNSGGGDDERSDENSLN